MHFRSCCLFHIAVALTFQSCRGKAKATTFRDHRLVIGRRPDGYRPATDFPLFLGRCREPNGSLAPRRYHVDGVYPENDANVVASGGSATASWLSLQEIDRGVTRERDWHEWNASFLSSSRPFSTGAYPHWWYGDTGR